MTPVRSARPISRNVPATSAVPAQRPWPSMLSSKLNALVIPTIQNNVIAWRRAQHGLESIRR